MAIAKSLTRAPAQQRRLHRPLVLSAIFFGVAIFLPHAVLAQDPLGANPPVRQTIGMMDVLFSSLTSADCLACHSDPAEPSLMDRHHLLTAGQPIPAGSIVPFPDTDGDTVNDPFYGCLSCHGYEGQWSNGSMALVRNCLVCHTASPHHTTPAAKSGDCVSCHGDIVDNIADGHYIPDYPTSVVTPSISIDGAEGGLPNNNRGNGAGACNYCHDHDGNADPDDRIILDNRGLHHADGLFGEFCAICHPIHGGGFFSMRGCERCHGPDSLHNIQADSPAAANIGTIVVGGEESGYGHVGRDSMIETSPDVWEKDSDCWGCHGFDPSTVTLASALASSPTIPSLYNIDVKLMTAGTGAKVVLSGVGFINIAGGITYKPKVSLTAADGSSVTLTPEPVNQYTITVTMPADTDPGH